MSAPPKVAFFLPSMEGGGAERIVANLLPQLDDFQLELVLGQSTGDYLKQLEQISIRELGCAKVTRCIPRLIRYFKSECPDVFVSHMSHANIASLIAARLARTPSRIVAVEHLSPSAYRGPVKRDRLIIPAARWTYHRAATVVSVSNGAAADWADKLGWDKSKIKVIHNPVVTDELRQSKEEPVDHPWLGDSVPCLLGVGRLSPQKDFQTLIRSVELLRREGSPTRLLILGEGESRSELEQIIKRSQLSDSVELVGQVSNPYRYMRRADCFVLSSRWEALPTVLIEAMACGTRIVATDCPSGPREILRDGTLGSLVPPQAPERLAAAIKATIEAPIDPRLAERAEDFSSYQAARKYAALIKRVAQTQN